MSSSKVINLTAAAGFFFIIQACSKESAIPSTGTQSSPTEIHSQPSMIQKAAAVVTCGSTGDTAERLQDCSKIPGSTVTTRNQQLGTEITWSLVARTPEGKEVWLDNQSGIVWSDVIDENMNGQYLDWLSYAPRTLELVGHPPACSNSKYENSRAGIYDREWYLPTMDDYGAAEQDGIRDVLPHWKDRLFWARFRAAEEAQAGPVNLVYNGNTGDLTPLDSLDYSASVRCMYRYRAAVLHNRF